MLSLESPPDVILEPSEVIPLNVVVFQSGNAITVGADSVITINESGVYEISYYIQVQRPTAVSADYFLYLSNINAGGILGEENNVTITGAYGLIYYTKTLQLNAGQQFALVFSAINGNLTQGSIFIPRMTITQLSRSA